MPKGFRLPHPGGLQQDYMTATPESHYEFRSRGLDYQAVAVLRKGKAGLIS